jgi:uncharacterized protein with gpF-like domain
VADDPQAQQKLQVFAAIVAAEQRVYAKIMDLLDRWATRLRSAVFGSPALPPSLRVPPNPLGVRQTATWFAQQVDNDVIVELRTVFEDALEQILPEGDGPNGAYRFEQAAKAARNRLVRVPDSVFAAVRAETLKATTEGWSIDELAAQVDDILAEAGAERWKNRARTIARTETIAAYNSGTYAGFLSYAKQLGGSWEKVWLETHDHRTRPTHRDAPGGVGGQRVPLQGMFDVGGFPMPYPGWPEGPPQEVINCRCSLLLAREGEIIDFSNRHSRGTA